MADVVLIVVARHDLHRADLVFDTLGTLSALVYASIGSLIVRRGSNVIGWILTGAGSALALSTLSVYAMVGLVSHPGSLPAPRLVAALTSSMWIPGLGSIAFMLMFFPTGALPSPRWRLPLRLGIAGAFVGFVGLTLTPRRLAPEAGLVFPNPIGLERFSGLISTILVASAWAAVVGVVASLVALILRFRGGDRELREQIKWLAFAAGAEGLLLLANFVELLACRCDHPPLSNLTFTLFFLVFALAIPGAIGIAVLKYRLYDIDVIIRRTVLYGALAACFTGVYVAIVVGVGAAVGARGNSFLTIAAAVVIALVFQPVRQRAQRLANRIVYGKRASPYEVLSEFSERMAGTYAIEDVLQRMARIMAEGTGANRAEVMLRIGDELRPAASWPDDGQPRASITLPDEDELPSFENVTRGVPVRHQGELLGALSVVKPRGEPLTPTEDKLLSDLASQGGLVLRNARLTAELRAHVQELRASRQRLVTAQDEERRKLERNLHDGAQQQLVALSVKLGLVKDLARRDLGRAESVIDELQTESRDALENLRDLARGIYPPLLADEGLPAALEAQARKAPLPVEIEARGIGRYVQEAEAAVYFCCLEALQNVAKYAKASRVRVRLSDQDGLLAFAVEDDGEGFDQKTTSPGTGLQGMADRLEALGGSVGVRSRPGRGTTITGRLPVRAVQRV